ncbi:MAG: hypothetical protein AB1324_02285 [Candidatus Micrarchaeota archaeon]
MRKTSRKKAELKRIGELVESSRREFQALILHETALMADSWVPEQRVTARTILGIGDCASVSVRFSRQDRARIATMKKVFRDEGRAIDALAANVLKEESLGDDEIRRKASKLVGARSSLLIKKHAAGSARGPNEKELLEAIESLDSRILAPLREDLARIARESPYESVRRAAGIALGRY